MYYARGYIDRNIGDCHENIGLPYVDSLFEFQFHDFEKNSIIWRYGIFTAYRRGLKLKYCQICRDYQMCRVSGDVTDINTNKKISVRNYPIGKLIEKKIINPVIPANKCKHFQMDIHLMKQVKRMMRNIKIRISKNI